MKYNPRINELVARTEGLAWAHPYQPEALSQGCMEVMARLEAALAEITGMDAVTLQPAAGAHGELTGILLIRALLEKRGNPRKKILIPDSAHGTNPGHRRHRRLRGREHHARTSAACSISAALERVGDRRRRRPDGDQSRTRSACSKRTSSQVAEILHAKGAHAVHGRRQHERAGGHRAARRFRRRRDAPQSAQDLLHAARRRRSGRAVRWR